MELLKIKPKDSLNEFVKRYSKVRNIDIQEYINGINDVIKYYKKPKDIQMENPLEHLENAWFNALENNKIDYSVYVDDDYVKDTWACWAMYSRLYLMKVHKNLDLFTEPINKVLDLGNGIGYSTAALTEIFPNSKVTATNLYPSEQWEFNNELQKVYNYDLIEKSDDIGEVDLVFASEYFEHILDPISEVENVIKKNKPKYFVIANSFGTVGIGHFKEYNVKGKIIDWKKISRVFINFMKDNGYIKVQTGFFNGTPNIYKLASIDAEYKELEEW